MSRRDNDSGEHFVIHLPKPPRWLRRILWDIIAVAIFATIGTFVSGYWSGHYDDPPPPPEPEIIYSDECPPPPEPEGKTKVGRAADGVIEWLAK